MLTILLFFVVIIPANIAIAGLVIRLRESFVSERISDRDKPDVPPRLSALPTGGDLAAS